MGSFFTEQVLKNAIKGEEKSAQFYANTARRIQHYNARALFEKLSIEEMKHRQFLEDWLAKTNFFIRKRMEALGDIDFSPSFNISDSFSPNFDAKGLKKHFENAINSENKSIADYLNLTLKIKDSQAVQVYQRLAEAEQMHKDLLLKEYNNLFSTPL